MFLSKIWFILVTLLAGVAVTAALVAPRPAVQKLEQLEGQRLDRAQYAAEQMLKVDARRWIDYVAKLGRDAIVQEALDSASRGAGELGVIHKTMKDRFRWLAPDPSKIGLDSLVAVDARGRVVARLGDDETQYKDSIAGAEVVADALRGYLSDDVWGAGGKLVRVAAAPVLSKTKDRVVGAIYAGAETGSRLAELWKKNLGIDIAIMLRGKVVASTQPEALLASIPDLVAQRASEIAEAKRTRAIPVPSGSDRLLVVAAPFAGQAAELDAYYALVGRRPARSDIASLLSNTSADDLKWGHFPWLPIGGGLVLVLGIGIFLQRYEITAPLSRMRKEMQRLARGEIQKLQDTQYPGLMGGIARDMNAAMERYTLAPAPPPAPALPGEIGGRDSNAVAAAAAAAAADRSFDLPPASSSPAGSGPGDLGPPPPPGFGVRDPFGLPPPPPPAPAFNTPAPALFAPGPSAFGAEPRGASHPAAGAVGPPSLPSLGALSGVNRAGPAARPTASAAPSPATPGRSGGMVLGRLSIAPPATSLPSLPSVAFSTRSEPPPEPELTTIPEPEPPPPAPDGDAPPFQPFPTGDAPAPDLSAEANDEPAPPAEEEDPESAHVRDVFQKYLETKKQCGEATEGLSLEKFRVKLEDNKTALMAKYSCKTVRFTVYVKDGRAALKATPVRA